MQIKVADQEDDGVGGEFLRVRVSMDITKPLPRCCKLKCDGKHIGWALLKFERLPNFCNWCGRVNHVEKDCEVWFTGRKKLRKEDQQFGDWFRAEQFRSFRKSVVVVAGSSCGPSKWKKGPSVPKEQALGSTLVRDVSLDLNSTSVMDSDPPLEHFIPVSTLSKLHLSSSWGQHCHYPEKS